jgi:hypothetical protein
MNLELDFSLCLTDDCCKAVFCDTTCEFDPTNPANCVNGYGYLDNPNISDIDYARFNWIFPDGTNFMNIDLGWKPGTKASNEFQVTGGTNGILIVDIENVVLGSAVFVVDIATTVGLLVTNINANTAITGWRANIKYGTTDFIVLTNVNYGTQFNGLQMNLTVSGDITVAAASGFLMANGTTDTNCHCITVQELHEATTPLPGSDCMQFPDGVHTVTYVIYDTLGQEIARKTQKFLFVCNLINGIEELILSMENGNCPCSHEDVNDRIFRLRVMIEQAQEEFDQCLFDCATDTVLRACKLYDKICTGC